MKAWRFSIAMAPIAMALLAASPVLAATSVTRFSATDTQTFAAPLEGCLPEDLVGTVTVTEKSTGQVVETGSGILTVHGINEYSYRIELPDGSSVQSWLNRDVYAFVLNGSHSAFNLVTQDFRRITAADGTTIGTLAIHALVHVTYDDRNGNGDPDPDEITSNLERFTLRCG